MLRTIQLHSEPGLVAEKIHDVVGDKLLTTEAGTAVAKKIVPQMPLLFRHIFTQGTSVGEVCVIFTVVQGAYLQEQAEIWGCPPLSQLR